MQRMHAGVYWQARPGYDRNQDSLTMQHILLQRGEGLLAVVCDGIGSLESAEEAGGIVVSRLTGWFYHEGKELICRNSSKEQILLSLQEQIFQIQELLRYFQKKEQLQTGTTCSGILFVRNRYYLMHIGDSRIYQFSKPIRIFGREVIRQKHCVRCLTVDDGDNKGRLQKALGLAGTDRAIVQTGKIKRRSGFLVCTDGFYRKLPMETTAHVLRGLLERKKADREIGAMLERRLEQLGRLALENGSRDDMSAIGILIL